MLGTPTWRRWHAMATAGRGEAFGVAYGVLTCKFSMALRVRGGMVCSRGCGGCCVSELLPCVILIVVSLVLFCVAHSIADDPRGLHGHCS